MALSISNNLQNLAANKNLGIQNAQNSNSTTSKQEFESLEDYTKYLSEKYGVNSGQRMISGVPTTISVASSVIKKAYEDPKEREILENHLKAMQSLDVALQTMAILAPSAEMTSVGFIIDDSGNLSMYSSGKTKDSWVNKGSNSLWQNNSNLKEELEKILEKAKERQEELKKDLEKAAQKAQQRQKELESSQEQFQNTEKTEQSLALNNQNSQTNLTQNFSFEVQGKNFDEILEKFKIAFSDTSVINLEI